MIDLRSDTVTQPSDGMRQAMAQAAVGDDVYGEDPTVNALEERTAQLLGMQAGLFCPTGSMANLLGVEAQTPPGTEVLAESRAHILRAESGAHGALAGVTSRTWVSHDGSFNAAQALSLVSPPGATMLTPTATISVENTANFWGGTVADPAELTTLRQETARAGVRVHIDGARLANAWVARGTAPEFFGQVADTISLCLSKGLGAPVGSVLVGDTETIAAARLLRKRHGGGMRQVGILAAAGLFALENNVERLADDHEHAKAIARTLAFAAPSSVDPAAVETNIVVLELPTGTASEVSARAAQAGVRVSQLGPSTLRLVTHLDVNESQATTAADVLAGILSSLT